MRAWDQDEWSLMLSLLDSIREFETTTDKILRGAALAGAGRYSAAIQEFERVRRQDIGRFGQELFFNQYANALRRAGRDTEAIALLRDAPLENFSQPQRRWAVALLASRGRWQDCGPRELPSLDGEWTHWWIEGDGFRLEVVPAEQPLRAYALVDENRDRMAKIVAFRCKFDPAINDYTHDDHSHSLSEWNKWTGRP